MATEHVDDRATETGAAGTALEAEVNGTAPETGENTAAIGRKAGRGLRWSILGNVVTKAGSFLMSLVLARLLVPEDYGLYAIALAASTFLIHVNDAGIIAATVQWRGRLQDLAPTATVMAFLFSLGVYGLFWVLTPYYAELSGSAEATSVVRLLTLIIVIDGVTAVRAGALMRRFQQDRLTMANMAGFCAQAVVSISLAVGGAGAFSFAWGQLASNTVTAVLVLIFARMPFRIGIDREVARHLLRFGLPLALALGIEGLLINVDKVVIGDQLGPVALGFYMVAFNVSSWVPGMIGTAVRYVSLPGFARLAEKDTESLSKGVQQAVPIMISFVLPIALLMATLSPELVTFLYGREWEPAGQALQFLSVVMIVRMLFPLASDILTALGRTRATVWLNLGWCVALIPAVLVGAHLGGIHGASIAQALVGSLVALPLAALALHRAGVRLGPIGPALVRPLAAAVIGGAVMLALSHVVVEIAPVRLAVAGGAGMIVFLVVVVPGDQLKRWGGRAVPARAR